MQRYVSVLMILLIASCSTVTTNYDRSAWHYGKDDKPNCINTRGEILIERSIKPVIMNKSKCTVRSGKWRDYYYPEIHTKASAVEIDHLVPLKNAHDHGGASWPMKKKKAFANDPANLVITKKSYNRIKGPKGIDEWIPSNISYACKVRLANVGVTSP